MKAGKIMLEHVHELADDRVDFAFETTLASRTFAPWIEKLKATGYRFHLYFLCLPNPELAIQRVRDRVSAGGHHVPDDTVRRRHRRGLSNFFHLFRPLADSWQLFDNTVPNNSRLIAEGSGTMDNVLDQQTWSQLQQGLTP
jgi:predicted ABC-type ATPase